MTPGGLGALDAAIEAGRLGRQNKEFDTAGLGFGREDGSERAAAIAIARRRAASIWGSSRREAGVRPSRII